MPMSAANAVPRAGESAGEGPYEELVALHRAGTLVEQYPRLDRLVERLSGAELLAAGQLLARLSPAEVTARHPTVPCIRVAVTGHGTLATLVPALAAQAARHGLVAFTTLADFDSYVFDLADRGSALYAAGADLTLCVLDPEVVFDEVPVPWRPDDVEHAFAEKLRLLDTLAATFEAGFVHPVVCTLATPT